MLVHIGSYVISRYRARNVFLWKTPLFSFFLETAKGFESLAQKESGKNQCHTNTYSFFLLRKG